MSISNQLWRGPARAGGRRLRAGLLLLALVAMPVASWRAVVAAPATVAYDIPAGDLDVALNAYIGASGMQVLYETRVTEGRRSSAIAGRLPPDVALRLLLAGSGLVARRVEVETFSITLAPVVEGEQAAPVAFSRPFVGALQARVIESLCRDDRTRPGDYRIAFELWISPAGTVERSALVGSTGNAARDEALRRALQGMAVRLARPPDLPQPVIVAIAPRPPTASSDCRPTLSGSQ